MPKYDTKLKLGRKLKSGSPATASDNQVSVLFRFDEEGRDHHVSVTIESDDMTAEDVGALLQFLESRGRFTREATKTWVSQPQASEARFGATTTWNGVDVKTLTS